MTDVCADLLERGGDDPESATGRRITDLVRTSNEVRHLQLTSRSAVQLASSCPLDLHCLTQLSPTMIGRGMGEFFRPQS